MTTITFDGAAGYLVRAKTQRAGVVLLPTIFGVNPFVRDWASTLAEHGITALVWDIYPGEDLPGDYNAAIKAAGRLRDAPALAAMTKCVDFLAGELHVTTVGTMGFCLGGRYVFMLAAQDRRLAACAAIYPSIHAPNQPSQDEDAVARAAAIACPVQLVYPGRDHITSNETFHRLQQNLQRRDAPTAVQYYPTAGHGFLHNDAPENQAAARQARPLISAFLAGCLG
ncbi:MAG TPA: dienelactone hydrolase family protein [Stellaceae bacterium]|nr:dienelactone hydrolase family protein [Stellaceae bacterium]